MLRFNGLLTAAGLKPAKIRLVRHRHGREYQRRVYQDAIHRDPRFEQYQSGQSNPTVIEQMCSAEAIAAFVVDPSGQTVFVGLWCVEGSREEYLADPYITSPRPPLAGSVVINLKRMAALSEYCGRIVVDWGGGERAWVQYADRRDKKSSKSGEMPRNRTSPDLRGSLAAFMNLMAYPPLGWNHCVPAAEFIFSFIVQRERNMWVRPLAATASSAGGVGTPTGTAAMRR